MYRLALALISFPYMLIAFEPEPVTPHPVCGYREISYYDQFHRVQRQILVWYPVDPALEGKPSEDPWDVFAIAKDAVPLKKKMPIVIVSHGYTGNPHQLSWIIRGLVHGGFIVLAIQHRDLNNGKAHVNHWQRPQDVKTVIDQFSKSSMKNFADLDKIGIAGFSLGGTTAIWVIGGRASKLDSLIPGPEFASGEDFTRADEALPSLNKAMMSKDWRDPRVKAAFVMAPAWAWLFDEESLRRISVPTYLIAASADKVLVTKNNAGYFAKNIPGSFYQAIPGEGDHYIFISALNSEEQKKADPKNELSFLFQNATSVDRSWIQIEVVEEAVRFFNSTLRQPN